MAVFRLKRLAVRITRLGTTTHLFFSRPRIAWPAQRSAEMRVTLGVHRPVPADAGELVALYKRRLADTASRVDAGYPSNTDPVLDGGKPVLRRRKGRRPPPGGADAGDGDP